MLAAAVPVLIDSVEAAEPPDGGVTGLGDRVHAAPLGHPETVKLTAELKPFDDVTVMGTLPEAPC